MGFEMRFHGTSMRFSWDFMGIFDGISIGISWDFMGI